MFLFLVKPQMRHILHMSTRVGCLVIICPLTNTTLFSFKYSQQLRHSSQSHIKIGENLEKKSNFFAFFPLLTMSHCAKAICGWKLRIIKLIIIDIFFFNTQYRCGICYLFLNYIRWVQVPSGWNWADVLWNSCSMSTSPLYSRLEWSGMRPWATRAWWGEEVY